MYACYTNMYVCYTNMYVCCTHISLWYTKMYVRYKNMYAHYLNMFVHYTNIVYKHVLICTHTPVRTPAYFPSKVARPAPTPAAARPKTAGPEKSKLYKSQHAESLVWSVSQVSADSTCILFSRTSKLYLF